MTIYNFFKNLFGIPNSDNPNNFREENFSRNHDEYRNRVWGEPETDYRDHMRDPSEGHYHNFSMFTDPLEMHRYFEQQMDEMMRSFSGFFGNHSEEWSPFGFGAFGNWGDMFTPGIEEAPNEHPALMPPPPPNRGSLRDHYLKPGYEQPRERNVDPRTDSDLDGKLDFGSLDSILGSKPKQELVPRQPNTPAPHGSYFYGKSVSSKTVRRPDGSVEHHRTTRDHEGNEETVITRQVGDKQYSVTTRKTKDGKEERIEDIVNMDEKDVSHFLNQWQRPRHEPPHDDPNRYFPFDKFFGR